MQRARRHKPGLLNKQPLKDPSLVQTINFAKQRKMASLLHIPSLTKEKTLGQFQKR